MPEYVERSIEAMQNAFKKLPKEAAVMVATEAAIRAEAMADYAELMNSGKPEKE